LEQLVTVTLNETFVEVIQAALKARFGRIPSASFIALQVNRRLGERQGVSGESARRWLRGRWILGPTCSSARVTGSSAPMEGSMMGRSSKLKGFRIA
jgi:hypothetical protein